MCAHSHSFRACSRRWHLELEEQVGSGSTILTRLRSRMQKVLNPLRVLQAFLFNLFIGDSFFFFLLSEKSCICHWRRAGTNAVHSRLQLHLLPSCTPLLHVQCAALGGSLEGKTEGGIQMRWDRRAGYLLLFVMHCHSKAIRRPQQQQGLSCRTLGVQYIFPNSVSKKPPALVTFSKGRGHALLNVV